MSSAQITAIYTLGIIGILLIIALILMLVIVYRKIHNVFKKVDYLVEDITYKSEMLTPVVESIREANNFLPEIKKKLQSKTKTPFDSLKDKPKKKN